MRGSVLKHTEVCEPCSVIRAYFPRVETEVYVPSKQLLPFHGCCLREREIYKLLLNNTKKNASSRMVKVKFTSCHLTTLTQSFVGLSSCSSTRCSKIYKVSENSFIINTRLYGWWGVHKRLMNISAESDFGHTEFIILIKNMQRSLFPVVCPHDLT